jgi:hypothetical protein
MAVTAACLAAVQENVAQIIFWCLVLALAVLVLFGGLWYYRRRWLRMPDSPAGTPWTFEDLQKMKEQGQISDEEYRALRATMIASFGGRKTESPSPGTSVENTDHGGKGSDFDLRNPPAG